MILCPDDQPERWTNPAEAFAHVARTLRDEVLPDPDITTVFVMVGPPGSGKSTWAQREEQRPIAVTLDACHADPKRRRALVKRIKAAGKRAVAVWMQTPLSVCLARNGDREQHRVVPARKVLEQHVALRRGGGPNMAEGWDDIIRVEYQEAAA